MAVNNEYGTEKSKKSLSELYKNTTSKLRDETFREKARSAIIYLLALALPLLYLGIFDTFSLDMLKSGKPIGLSIVSLISTRLVFFEISKRAHYDEHAENEELKEAKKENARLKKKAHKEFDLAREFNNEQNKKLQEQKNSIAKEHELEDLKEQINKRVNKGKNVSKLETKRERIETNGVYDNSFKPIDIIKLIYKNKSKKTSNVIDDTHLHYSAIADGFIKSTGISLFRSFGLGIAGSAVFLLDEPIENILIYYGGLLLLILATTVTRYDRVRKNVEERELDTIEKQNGYLEDMVEYIDKQLQDQHKQDTVAYPLERSKT